MIFITGDMHGAHDIIKFSPKHFTMQSELTRSDHVIICGDFGLLWSGSEKEKKLLEWLEERPWTTLWIDGNHENFDMLKAYPIEEWNGGQIQRITEHIFHLCRGNVFEIEGRSFFAFGGAESHDKHYREYGKSIWKEEMPSDEEIERGRQALKNVGMKADYIITHSLPSHIQDELFDSAGFCRNRLTDFFDEVDEKANFKLWFSGHYHYSGWYDKKHILIYNDIVRLTDKGIERVCSLEGSQE